MKPKWKWLSFVTISSMIVPLATVACQPENKTGDGSGQNGGGDQNNDKDNNGGDDNNGDDNNGGDKNDGRDKNNPEVSKDEFIGEVQKLTYTGLNEAELKTVTITDDTLLTEDVAEQLGFILPDTVKNLIEKPSDTKDPQFQVKVSKAKDDLKVIYKCKKTTEADDQVVAQEVTMTPYAGDELTTTLDSLKQYKESAKIYDDWLNAYAQGLKVAIDSSTQNKYLQIKGLTDFAKTLESTPLKAYVRKTKGEETLKYVVVKTLDSGGKVIRIGEPITVVTPNLETEIQKLTYTGLNDAEFKALTITDGTVLTEDVAEKLGFVLPDTVRIFVETQPNHTNPRYEVKVSKAKDDVKVTYKLRKTTEAEDKAVTKEVTMIPYTEDDLTTSLDGMKQYKTTELTHIEWLKAKTAEGFAFSIDGNNQKGYYKLKGLADYAKTLGQGLKGYVRKAQGEETIKYVIVKTLDSGNQIIKITDPITVITTDIESEISKLLYTSLSGDEFKALTIAEGTVLTEEVAEQLGFVLPDSIKKFIEKQPYKKNPEYVVKVSKAKDDNKVTYKFRRTTEAEDQALIAQVPMIPYVGDDLINVLNDLKQYNETTKKDSDWLKAYAEELKVAIDDDNQEKYLGIKGLAEYAKTLGQNIKAYIRKTKDEETMKYVVVQTVDSGARVIRIGEPITVTTTYPAIAKIRDKLKVLMTKQINPLFAATTEDDFKSLEQTRVQILPDGGTPYDWSLLKIIIPPDQLPTEDMLQDEAALDKGKIEIEKKIGETTLHWYITYVDENNATFTGEYLAEVKLAATFPTVAEAEAKDWTTAKVLNYGDSPSGIDGGDFNTKPVLTRITLDDDTVFYLYTSEADNVGIAQGKRYSGTRLDDKRNYWVASNATSNDIKEIRILQTKNASPGYEGFQTIPKEVKYMYL